MLIYCTVVGIGVCSMHTRIYDAHRYIPGIRNVCCITSFHRRRERPTAVASLPRRVLARCDLRNGRVCKHFVRLLPYDRLYFRPPVRVYE